MSYAIDSIGDSRERWGDLPTLWGKGPDIRVRCLDPAMRDSQWGSSSRMVTFGSLEVTKNTYLGANFAAEMRTSLGLKRLGTEHIVIEAISSDPSLFGEHFQAVSFDKLHVDTLLGGEELTMLAFKRCHVESLVGSPDHLERLMVIDTSIGSFDHASREIDDLTVTGERTVQNIGGFSNTPINVLTVDLRYAEAMGGLSFLKMQNLSTLRISDTNAPIHAETSVETKCAIRAADVINKYMGLRQGARLPSVILACQNELFDAGIDTFAHL